MHKTRAIGIPCLRWVDVFQMTVKNFYVVARLERSHWLWLERCKSQRHDFDFERLLTFVDSTIWIHMLLENEITAAEPCT